MTATHHQKIGRIGGLVSAATRTPEQEAHRKERAAAGRMKRYLDQIPADVTDPAERMRRASLLQTAHMQKIALVSARRRRQV
ncbi:hypothetical protein ACQPZX_42780 [Actinoplanes sp. CA-142083]|uniref:hypothetical protein n=1 Tax=Actinoplanes sp. CA-142083 TaxID=3239903 RepID=UPI003D8E0F4C